MSDNKKPYFTAVSDDYLSELARIQLKYEKPNYGDLIDISLNRARGLAGLLAAASQFEMGTGNTVLEPDHIHQSANAIEQEIKTLQVLIEGLFAEWGKA